MEVFLKPSFIKDFQKLPSQIKAKIKEVCFIDFPKAKSLSDPLLQACQIKLLTGFSGYYRIRIGNHRVGFKKEKDRIIFMRVLHRKDIYKFFP